MSLPHHKAARIASLIAPFQGRTLDAHYLGYFAFFNQGLAYEAHDILEDLWLRCRREPEGDFYKGLIQLAGAFVHLQKRRFPPAGALLDLAARNLAKYAPVHQCLDLSGLLTRIQQWRQTVTSVADPDQALTGARQPRIDLLENHAP